MQAHERGQPPIGGPDALAPGLYLVATPIGHARDITLRALDVLAAATVLVAEDTRRLRRLLDIHGVALGGRPLWAHHDHGGAGSPDRVAAAVAAGHSVAYASEAGTPLVSDPGLALVRAVLAAGGAVTAAPGASAALAALTLSGLPAGRFLFLGFLPPKAGERRRLLEAAGRAPATLILFESPKRISKTLSELADIFGPDREAAMAREITKKFEEVARGTLSELAARATATAVQGEVVVLVAPAPTVTASAAEIDAALGDALARLSVRDATDEVAAALQAPRREVYRRALALTSDRE